jgi:hypothetical protein
MFQKLLNDAPAPVRAHRAEVRDIAGSNKENAWPT